MRSYATSEGGREGGRESVAYEGEEKGVRSYVTSEGVGEENVTYEGDEVIHQPCLTSRGVVCVQNSEKKVSA